MSAESIPPLDIRSWQVQLLRLTGFLISTPNVAEIPWWKDVTGTDPDESTSKKGGIRVDEGRYRNGI